MEELLEQLLHMGIGQSEEPPRVINLAPKVEEPDSVSSLSLSESTPTTVAEVDVAGVDDKDSEVTHDEEKDGSEGGDGEEDAEAPAVSYAEQILIVEQVKVIDHMGGLKIVYPSRVDLKSKTYAVTRDYE